VSALEGCPYGEVRLHNMSGQRSEDKMVVHFGSPMIPILFRSNV